MSLAGRGLVEKSSPYWELIPIGNCSPTLAIAFLSERERSEREQERSRRREGKKFC